MRFAATLTRQGLAGLAVSIAVLYAVAPAHPQERARDGLRPPRDFSVDPSERPASPSAPRRFERTPDTNRAPSGPQPPAVDRSAPPPPARFDPLRCPPGRSPTFCD